MKEADITVKTFRIYVPMEAFSYLCYKVPHAIKATMNKKESNIIYYNNLQMEARSCRVTKTYVRCLDKRSLNELRQILGNGIGIGLSGRRPTKSCPLKYCTLNGKLNSVEVDDSIAPAIQANPLMTQKNNGIDFLYSNETRQLSCNVRFTSMTVTNPEVAISRIRTADVKRPATSAFIGAWFLRDNVVYEVVKISGNLAWCKDPDDEETDAVLHQFPLELVSELVNNFGR
jgi:hypothetical protein